MKNKIPFVEVLKRITGISTPVFGISWEPPKIERDTAKKLLTYLEDRRLLFTDYEILLRYPAYVKDSLHEMRNMLTEELESLDRSSPLAKSVSSMRAACRKCVTDIEKYPLRYEYDDTGNPLADFHGIGWMAIGELRATFGILIAQLCSTYGLGVEEELKSILPPLDLESTKNGDDSA